MTALLLLRHGQTSWNREGRSQGRQDVPLDARGRRQAEAVAPHVAALGPHRLLSSSATRARQTAEAVGAVCGLPVEGDDRLVEVSLGLWEGLTTAEVQARYPDEYRAWRQGGDVRRGGGETYVETAARAVAAIAPAVSGPTDPGLVAVVSHGGTLRALMGALLELPVSAWMRLKGLPNCGWALLQREPASAGDAITAGWRLAAYGIQPTAVRDAGRADSDAGGSAAVG